MTQQVPATTTAGAEAAPFEPEQPPVLAFEHDGTRQVVQAMRVVGERGEAARVVGLSWWGGAGEVVAGVGSPIPNLWESARVHSRAF